MHLSHIYLDKFDQTNLKIFDLKQLFERITLLDVSACYFESFLNSNNVTGIESISNSSGYLKLCLIHFKSTKHTLKNVQSKKVKSDKRYNLTEKQNLIELMPSGLSEML